MITYLASPYTKGEGTVEDRVSAACKAAVLACAEALALKLLTKLFPHVYPQLIHLFTDKYFDYTPNIKKQKKVVHFKNCPRVDSFAS